VLCDDDIPYDDTWERSGDVNRHDFQMFNRQYLKKHGIKHILVSGSIEQRRKKVLKSLGIASVELCTN
jgi:nicotinamide riboside kinase